MSGLLSWLPDVLKSAGLRVAEVDGWEARGTAGNFGPIKGVMCHHTAGPRSGNMPSLDLIRKGRPGLSGPLAQLGLGRDGTFYIIAAGRANHAGAGIWQGVSSGNTSFIGIEAENDGVGEVWPDVQLEAYQRGVAAILKHIGASAVMCCGHREYALPAGRKIDPTGIDMPSFRQAVTVFLGSDAPAPKLVPAVDDLQRRTLHRGMDGADVRTLQTKLGLEADGLFGSNTEAAVREFQRNHQLVPDGIVGPKSWAALPA